MNWKLPLLLILLCILFYFIIMNHKVYIGNSAIHGKGLFAKKEIKKGEYLFDVGYFNPKKEFIITKMGALINHCKHKNTEIKLEGDYAKIYTTENIEKNQEIVIDYDIVAKKLPVLKSKPNWKCEKKNYLNTI